MHRMTRLQRPSQQPAGHPAHLSLSAWPDGVLPEHMLLRWLHDSGTIDTIGSGLPRDIESALKLASTIAATQAQQGSNQDCSSNDGEETSHDDDGVVVEPECFEPECFDLGDLTDLFGITADGEPKPEPEACIEEATMSSEPEDTTAISTIREDLEADATPEAEAIDESAAPNDALPEQELVGERLTEDALPDAAVADAAVADADVPEAAITAAEQTDSQEQAESHEVPGAQDELAALAQDLPKRVSSSHFKDAELGALMAEISNLVGNLDEEQQALQNRFREPELEAAPQLAKVPSNYASEIAETVKPSVVANEFVDEEADEEATSLTDAAGVDAEDAEPPLADEDVATFVDSAVADTAVDELATDAMDARDATDENADLAAASPQPEAPTATFDAAAKGNDAGLVDAGSDAAQPPQNAAATSEPAAEIPTPAPAEAASADQDRPTKDEEFALTNASVDRVQDFLGELKSALVEMAQRPQQVAVDVEPLVQALQAGFDRSAEQASQTSTAVASLSEHMTQFGRTIEGGVNKSIASMMRQPATPPGPAPLAAAPQFVERASNQAVVLGAVAIAVLGWSILFWIKTGSPRLALGTLIGANAIACCLLLTRRNRS